MNGEKREESDPCQNVKVSLQIKNRTELSELKTYGYAL